MDTQICTTEYTYLTGPPPYQNEQIDITVETCVLQTDIQQYLDLFSFLAMFIIFVTIYKLIKEIVFFLLK